MRAVRENLENLHIPWTLLDVSVTCLYQHAILMFLLLVKGMRVSVHQLVFGVVLTQGD